MTVCNMDLIFSVDKISPIYSVAILGFAIFISIFFGLSRRKGIKIFIISLFALSILSAMIMNFYVFKITGVYSNSLFNFGLLEMIEIGVFLFGTLNILLFISISNIESSHFVKILMLFLFSICCIIFLIISRNFIVIFLSLCLSTISVFQLISSLNNNIISARRYILKFFLRSSLAVILVFFGFSLIYGATDFKSFMQIFESDAISNPLIAAGVLFFGIAVYLFLFIFPFQGPYLKLARRCENSSLPVIWFLYFPIGIFLFLKLDNIIFYFLDNNGSYMSILFIILAFGCILGGNIGAVKTTSLRRILSFIFLVFIGLVLLNYAMCSTGLIGRDRVDWLNTINLILLLLSFLPIYSVLSIIEKKFKNDSLSNIRGFARTNKYFGVNIVIIILSLCGFIGTIGFLSRFYYLEPFISYAAGSEVIKLDLANIFILILITVAFIFLVVNMLRIIILLFKSNQGKYLSEDKSYTGRNESRITFPRFYYIYITFFTLIIVISGIIGLLEILNIDIGFLNFQITDFNLSD